MMYGCRVKVVNSISFWFFTNIPYFLKLKESSAVFLNQSFMDEAEVSAYSPSTSASSVEVALESQRVNLKLSRLRSLNQS